jgi:P4 family phage/plasmid primase-like protien
MRRWTGTHYEIVDDPALTIRQELQQEHIAVTVQDVTNILAEVRAFTSSEDEPVRAGLIPFRNGILDLGTRKLLPHSPDRFVCWCLDFDYDQAAVCPRWATFVAEVMPEDSGLLLQEFFGYTLSGEISRQKFLLMVGKSRSGKGTASNVLSLLIGAGNAIGFSISRIVDRFSTSALVDKPLAVVGEVELDGREKNKVLERFKCLTGNDPQPIERKGKDVTQSVVLPTRWVVSCNEMPHLHDGSGALAQRMLVIRFRKSFAGKEDVGLLDVLKCELAGICNWALAGLDRLNSAGWTKTADQAEEHRGWARNSSSALPFVQDCCRVPADWVDALTPDVETVETAGGSVNSDDLKRVYDEWSLHNGIDTRFNWMLRQMRELFPKLPAVPPQRRENGKRVRYLPGIVLKEDARNEFVRSVTGRHGQLSLPEQLCKHGQSKS